MRLFLAVGCLAIAGCRDAEVLDGVVLACAGRDGHQVVVAHDDAMQALGFAAWQAEGVRRVFNKLSLIVRVPLPNPVSYKIPRQPYSQFILCVHNLRYLNFDFHALKEPTKTIH